MMKSAGRGGIPGATLWPLLLLSLVFFMAPLALAQEERFAYELEITGLQDKSSQKLFNELSRLRQTRKDPPKVFAELQYAIRSDVETLTEILRANGYYGARVSYQLDRSRRPFALRIIVVQGPRFTIEEFKVVFTDGTEGEEKLQKAVAPLIPKPGAPAISTRVVEAEQAILIRLPEIGHPGSTVEKRDIVVDHEANVMRVELRIAAGPEVFFAAPEFTGSDSVRDSFLSKLTPWEKGELYDSRKVEEMRRELAETNLFGSIETSLGKTGPGGLTPVQIRLADSLHRTYGFGANWASDDGFGANASWEHRNFFNGGERFRVEGRAAEIEQSLLSSLDIPAFLRGDQRLLLDVSLAHEQPEAYTRWGADSSAVVEREFDEIWTAQAGASLEYANIEDVFGSRNYYLIGGLAGLRRDSTDDLFDPTRGSRLFVSARPYVGQQSGILQFLVSEIGVSAYWSLDEDSRYIAAGRLRFGSITGASLLRLPADKRFYAGGGSSIRGYRYQFAGPIGPDGDPIGGRSLVEAGAELRVRVTDTIGVVPFTEAGKVDDDTLPDFGGELFWAAGLGLRYYTGFAPIRLDVAIPLNKREIDSGYQIYISLGQSF